MNQTSLELLGAGNGAAHYALVVAVYAMLFLLMRPLQPRVPLSFRRTYWTLYLAWAPTIFVGNYLCYRAGVMSFLPWLNNALHTFVWIGLCLGFLYAAVRDRSPLEQFALFAIYSFIVKYAEQRLLGTWEHPGFFGIRGNAAYLIGWSLMDGLYPFISRAGLRVLGRVIPGVQREVLR